MFDIKYELNQVPLLPGVYIMRDENDDILYIGKAKLLKNRVKQYFQNNKNMLPRTVVMVAQIKRFEYIVTSSELEALILERNLIKKHRPPYNIMLKDDKNYPLIKVTVNEQYPRVFMTRTVKKDNARYFGPYTSGFAVKETIELINSIYPLKKCNKIFPRDILKTRPCINYQIAKCLAPCQGSVNQKAYKEMIDEVCRFLSGDFKQILVNYRKDMEKYAEKLEFEKASVLRDRIRAIETMQKSQNVSLTKLEQGDFIAAYGDDLKVCIAQFFLRGNNIVGRHHHILDKPLEKTTPEIFSEFILQYYDQSKIVPKTIYLESDIEERDEIEKYLSEKTNRKIHIFIPKRGEKKAIIKMASTNARLTFERKIKHLIEKEKFLENALSELSNYLVLDSIKRIESFDISNTGKQDTVASMIVFNQYKFEKRSYRKYSIRGDYGINDYLSMQEVVFRRYRYLSKRSEFAQDRKKATQALLTKPDLILVDGGVGHVNAVLEVLKQLEVSISVAGMIKDDHHKTSSLTFDGEIYDLKNEQVILRLLYLIQEEVHRFTIAYNRDKRKKRVIKSKLDDIEGVGPKKRQYLIKHFGSVKKIKEASINEIASVKYIDNTLAKRIKDTLT